MLEKMAVGNFQSTNSSQQLMNADAESVNASSSVMSSIDGDDAKRPSSRNSHQYNGLRSITYGEWFSVGVLCFVNLINYMDRFTIAGVLPDIQQKFDMNDSQAGLLQTVFVISYMIWAPLFGYLGDRYSRRWNMISGVALWSATTFIGSYMNSYTTFIIFRAMVGIGEASYSTIAPTIISDLFINDVRSKMLALFYFAIPVGSGCGYIVGSKMASFMNDWRWALRVTPILGLIAVILIYFTQEPERGQHEGSHGASTSYTEDLKHISRNPSFMLSTLGFTCVAFVTGALAWWGPKFMLYGLKVQRETNDVNLDDVSYKFGIVAMMAGLVGVPLGSGLAQYFRHKHENSDPIICAWGLLISAPLVYVALLLARISDGWCFFVIFLAEVSLNICWSIVADILLYVVMPTRRSTAEAFQILISHALGDAGSPYFIGLISQSLNTATHSTPETHADNIDNFRSLQYALFVTCFIEIIGGVFFLITSLYILRDKRKVEEAISGSHITDVTSSQITSHDQSNRESHYNPAIENYSDSLRD